MGNYVRDDKSQADQVAKLENIADSCKKGEYGKKEYAEGIIKIASYIKSMESDKFEANKDKLDIYINNIYTLAVACELVIQ